MRMSSVNNVSHIIDEMYRFEDQLSKLSLKVYPSNDLRKLITEELIPVVSELRELLVEEKELIVAIPQAPYSARSKAIFNLWSSNVIQDISNAISGADLKSHPIEIMTIFREMISNVEGTNFEIITSPVNELNFTFREIWIYFKEQLQHELGIIRTTDKKFVELTFPQKHKDNVFLSGIYAHEIGHYFDRNRKIWAKIFTQVVRGHTKLRELAPYFGKGGGQPVTEAEILSVLEQSVIGSWIREAIADCVAIYLVGPAFIFSSTDLLISIHGNRLVQYDDLYDIPSVTHPRDGLRNKFQLHLLKNIGLFDRLDDTLKQHIENIASDWNNAKTVAISEIIGDYQLNLTLNQNSYAILEDILNDCLVHVETEVANLIGAHRIRAEHLDEANRLAEERLKWLVPPNELDGLSVSYQSIINSAWYAEFLFKDEIINLVGRLEGNRANYDFRNIMNGLLRYAIHAAKIQKGWS